MQIGDGDDDVAVAYHITRAVFLTAYGALVLMFAIQARLQLLRDGRRLFFSFKTVHSTFILGGLLMSILTFVTWIDGSSVFGIYPLPFPEITWQVAVSVWVTCYLFCIYVAIRSLHALSSSALDTLKRRGARVFTTCLVVVNWLNIIVLGVWFLLTRRWTPNVISWCITELIITTSIAFEVHTFITVSRRLKGKSSPQLKRWKSFTIVSAAVIPPVCLVHLYLNISYMLGPERLSRATDDYYNPQQWGEHTRVLFLGGIWVGTATMLFLAWKPLTGGDGSTRQRDSKVAPPKLSRSALTDATGADGSRSRSSLPASCFLKRSSPPSGSRESRASIQSSRRSDDTDGAGGAGGGRPSISSTEAAARMAIARDQQRPSFSRLGSDVELLGAHRGRTPSLPRERRPSLQQRPSLPRLGSDVELLASHRGRTPPSRPMEQRPSLSRLGSDVELLSSHEARRGRISPSHPLEHRPSLPRLGSDVELLSSHEAHRGRTPSLPRKQLPSLPRAGSDRGLVANDEAHEHLMMMAASRQRRVTPPRRQRAVGLSTSVEPRWNTNTRPLTSQHRPSVWRRETASGDLENAEPRRNTSYNAASEHWTYLPRRESQVGLLSNAESPRGSGIGLLANTDVHLTMVADSMKALASASPPRRESEVGLLTIAEAEASHRYTISELQSQAVVSVPEVRSVVGRTTNVEANRSRQHIVSKHRTNALHRKREGEVGLELANAKTPFVMMSTSQTRRRMGSPGRGRHNLEEVGSQSAAGDGGGGNAANSHRQPMPRPRTVSAPAPAPARGLPALPAPTRCSPAAVTPVPASAPALVPAPTRSLPAIPTTAPAPARESSDAVVFDPRSRGKTSELELSSSTEAHLDLVMMMAASSRGRRMRSPRRHLHAAQDEAATDKLTESTKMSGGFLFPRPERTHEVSGRPHEVCGRTHEEI